MELLLIVRLCKAENKTQSPSAKKFELHVGEVC